MSKIDPNQALPRLQFLLLALGLVCLFFSATVAAQRPQLVRAYDLYLERLLESADFVGSLVMRRKVVHLPVETRIPNAGIVSDVPMVGLAGDITEPRGGRFMAVPQGGGALYVSRTRNMEDCVPASLYPDKDGCFIVRPGELVPGVAGHALRYASVNQVTLSVSNMYASTRLVNSLIDMYKHTRRERYLRLAAKTLTQLTTHHIGDDGVVRANWLLFERNRPFYRGMNQAILMHVLTRYLEFLPNDRLADALLLLAKTFVHTAEGCYNHFTNSAMGVAITNDVLGVQSFIPGRITSEINTMLETIEANDGRISYVMARSSLYPMFKNSYQAYDFFALGRLIRYYPFGVDKELLRKILPDMLAATEQITFPDGDLRADLRGSARVINALRYY